MGDGRADTQPDEDHRGLRRPLPQVRTPLPPPKTKNFNTDPSFCSHCQSSFIVFLHSPMTRFLLLSSSGGLAAATNDPRQLLPAVLASLFFALLSAYTFALTGFVLPLPSAPLPGPRLTCPRCPRSAAKPALLPTARYAPLLRSTAPSVPRPARTLTGSISPCPTLTAGPDPPNQAWASTVSRSSGETAVVWSYARSTDGGYGPTPKVLRTQF